MRPSTTQNYLAVWRLFNKFLLRLDSKPASWEDHATMFAAYMIDKGSQSSTIKSYMSAIKGILRDDGYPWNDDLIKLTALTRACRLVNDTLRCRLPIKSGLLELLLFEVQRKFGQLQQQPYLESMYLALFSIAYYDLMRIGELVQGSHTVRAKDIHVGQNKNKMLIVLYSLKMHSKAHSPQEIRIEAMKSSYDFNNHRFFCPFKLMRTYLQHRGGYAEDNDMLFVHIDHSVVTQSQVQTVLRDLLTSLNLDCSLYGFHSFRSGRASDLFFKNKLSLEEVKAQEDGTRIVFIDI